VVVVRRTGKRSNRVRANPQLQSAEVQANTSATVTTIPRPAPPSRSAQSPPPCRLFFDQCYTSTPFPPQVPCPHERGHLSSKLRCWPPPPSLFPPSLSPAHSQDKAQCRESKPFLPSYDRPTPSLKGSRKSSLKGAHTAVTS